MATEFKAFLIQCITNLHVGSGDTNYGVIDKLIQRDTVTQYPTIHSSSLKGALREHFENHPVLKTKVNKIFGKEGEDNDTGTYKFINADILAFPIRSSFRQYVMAFDDVITEFVNYKSSTILSKRIFKNFQDKNAIYGSEYQGDIYAEDLLLEKLPKSDPFEFENILFDRFATIKNEKFKSFMKNLPVIARNKVGKEDKNLWYEEVVPHKSLFITFIGSREADPEFEKALIEDNIQIGANSSVGYGLCKFYSVKFK